MRSVALLNHSVYVYIPAIPQSQTKTFINKNNNTMDL